MDAGELIGTRIVVYGDTPIFNIEWLEASLGAQSGRWGLLRRLPNCVLTHEYSHMNGDRPMLL